MLSILAMHSYFYFFLKKALFPLLFANNSAVSNSGIHIELRKVQEAYFEDKNSYDDL